MEPDPLREIREIRRSISKECGDDSEKVFAYYIAHQEKMKASGKYTFVTQPVDRTSVGMPTEQSDDQKKHLL